jgi:hypothetical protein
MSIYMHDDEDSIRVHQTIPIDQDEILFDIGDIEGDGYPELIFITENGVYFRKQKGRIFNETLSPLLQTGSVFPAFDPTRLRRWPLTNDLDQDGRSEIILPKSHQFLIYSTTSNGQLQLYRKLWAYPEYSFSERQMQMTMRLPLPRLGDFNGDKLNDLLLLDGDRMDVYIQHPTEDQLLAPQLIPPNLSYRMGARNVSASALEPIAPASVFLEPVDLNNDHYVDLILSKASRGSFINSISQIQIFLNKHGRYDQLPDQVLTAENFGGEHVIYDFNRDGLLDIALLTFKVGFTQASRFLFTKKAGNAYEFYLMRTDHTYPDKSDFKISFSRKVSLNDLFGSGLCSSFQGDYNGDGISDIMIGTDTDEISIFYGEKSGSFNKKALKIEATPSNKFLVGDINEDGYSDIILWYDRQDLQNQISLLRNKSIEHHRGRTM